MILLLHISVIIAGTIFFESFLVIKEDIGYGFLLRQILYFHFGNFEDFGHCCNCSCHPLLQLHVSLGLGVGIYFHLFLWRFKLEEEQYFLCLYSMIVKGVFAHQHQICERDGLKEVYHVATLFFSLLSHCTQQPDSLQYLPKYEILTLINLLNEYAHHAL